MRTFGIVLFAIIISLLAVRNLPWHLEDYDQAKQAYASLDMLQNGRVFYQGLPLEGYATKPPFLAWLSGLAYFAVGGNWAIAWRLPSFVCAMALLFLLYRQGKLYWGVLGGCLAAGAFALNMLTIRISTLVRTDMLLALLSFLAGWLILRHVEKAKAWSRGAKWGLAIILTLAVLTKGHIVYAFLLPGLVAFSILSYRRGLPNRAWTGWWPWILPLLVLGAWFGVGVFLQSGFFEQLFMEETLVAFNAGPYARQGQPPFYYALHLLHKFAPWSLALLVLLFFSIRQPRKKRDNGLLWLLCWGIGGLVLMELIPQKRVDRVYPVIAPLCLLIVKLASSVSGTGVPDSLDRYPVMRRVTIGVLVFAMLAWGGYGVSCILAGYKKPTDSLKRFANECRHIAKRQNLEIILVAPDNEGLLCYLEKTDYIRKDNLKSLRKSAPEQALIVPVSLIEETGLDDWQKKILVSGVSPFHRNEYVMLKTD